MLPLTSTNMLLSRPSDEEFMAVITRDMQALSIGDGAPKHLRAESQDITLVSPDQELLVLKAQLDDLALTIDTCRVELIKPFQVSVIPTADVDNIAGKVQEISSIAHKAVQTLTAIRKGESAKTFTADPILDVTSKDVLLASKRLYNACIQAKYLIANARALKKHEKAFHIPLLTVDFLNATMVGREIFQESKELGTGGFSHVYSVLVLDQESRCALKLPKKVSPLEHNHEKKRRSVLEAIRKENVVLSSISHPNIVHVELIGQDLTDPLNKPPFLVMEQADTTLSDYLYSNELKIEQLAKIILDISSALNYLHNECQIAFCDLKPENILLFFNSDGSITAKLSDFGLANLGFEKIGFRGTAEYASPEIASNGCVIVEDSGSPKAHYNTITGATDIWSLGILIYRLMGQQVPSVSDSYLRAERLSQMKTLASRPDADSRLYEAYVAPLQESLDPVLDRLDPDRIIRDEILPKIFLKTPSDRLTAADIEEIFSMT